MSIEEMLLGYTINGAGQLDIEARKGSIQVGKDADFLVFEEDLLTAEHAGFSYIKPRDVYICSSETQQSDQPEYKENAVVSYLGPEGTYTEEATEFFFHSSGSFVPKATVDEAIEDAASGVSDYAVIPQEKQYRSYQISGQLQHRFEIDIMKESWSKTGFEGGNTHV